MDDKRIPKLRFPGFTDEWEQRKLGEIFSSLQNNTLSRAELSTEKGIAKNVHYGDILIKFGEVLDIRNEKLPMITDEATVTKYKTSFLRNGDVIVADTAEDETVGKCSEMVGLCGETVIAGLHTIPYRPIFHFARGYLGYYMNSTAYHQQLLPLMQGIKVTSISKTAMQNTDITYPKSEDEQAKMGNYFTSLEHLITLHQRKCDSLNELRDGIIQRIFSRELRFKRSDGRGFENWVTKELSEIFTERKVSQTITEDAPLLSFTIEQGVINSQDKKTNKRDFLIKDKDMKKFALTEVDDIIYNPANLKYGAIHRNKLMRGVVSPIYAIFYTEQNPAFMEYVVKNPAFIKNSMKYLEGTVIKLMTLKPRDFLKLKVEIPASLEEQDIIAEFLMKFDETINIEQKKIEKWKELKKGLLQQMFV